MPPPALALYQVLRLLSNSAEPFAAGPTLPLLLPPPDPSQTHLPPDSPLHLPPLPVLGTHTMALHPSSVAQRPVLPSPPASSLPDVLDHESQFARADSPTATCGLATLVTDPTFEYAASSALVTELVDFAVACCLDYFTTPVSDSHFPPSVRGELAFDSDVHEDRQFELECLVGAVPHLATILHAPEGNPDALDITTPHSYAEAIKGQYCSQWQTTMDAEMASYKSTGTYVDAVPPPRVLQRFRILFSSPQPTLLPTGHSLSAPPLDESVEPCGPYLELVGCLMPMRAARSAAAAACRPTPTRAAASASSSSQRQQQQPVLTATASASYIS
ncbi:unnamed protein product [Closterium sp. NIES-54]